MIYLNIYVNIYIHTPFQSSKTATLKRSASSFHCSFLFCTCTSESRFQSWKSGGRGVFGDWKNMVPKNTLKRMRNPLQFLGTQIQHGQEDHRKSSLKTSNHYFSGSICTFVRNEWFRCPFSENTKLECGSGCLWFSTKKPRILLSRNRVSLRLKNGVTKIRKNPRHHSVVRIGQQTLHN